jgi:hypothetical protein
VSAGNSPPSRLMASWILVSFVSRARAAERTLNLGVKSPIVEDWTKKVVY